MKVLTCAATRRRLQAFHDQELPISDEIAVASHLDWCDRCADSLADLRLIRATLRDASPGRQTTLSSEEDTSLRTAVVGRIKAEREVGAMSRLRAMFDDMHLVYAGLGAAAATIVCVVIALGMMRFATRGRPDSLAAIVNVLASPGSNENPVAVDGRVRMPRALDGTFPTTASDAEEDVVFTLAAVVTREGRIANLEVLNANQGDAKLADRLLDAVSQARFEPAEVAGSPVAVNMVWLFAHTTVRGSAHRPLGAGAVKKPAVPAASPVV